MKGNEESYLNIPESDDGQFEISRWSRNQLLPEQIEWLNQLPEQLEIEDVDFLKSNFAPHIGFFILTCFFYLINQVVYIIFYPAFFNADSAVINSNLLQKKHGGRLLRRGKHIGK